MAEERHLTTIWARVGMTIQLTDDELNRILENKSVSFSEIFKDGRAKADGDSYIPASLFSRDCPSDEPFYKAAGCGEDEEMDDFEINISE